MQLLKKISLHWISFPTPFCSASVGYIPPQAAANRSSGPWLLRVVTALLQALHQRGTWINIFKGAGGSPCRLLSRTEKNEGTARRAHLWNQPFKLAAFDGWAGTTGGKLTRDFMTALTDAARDIYERCIAGFRSSRGTWYPEIFFVCFFLSRRPRELSGNCLRRTAGGLVIADDGRTPLFVSVWPKQLATLYEQGGVFEMAGGKMNRSHHASNLL